MYVATSCDLIREQKSDAQHQSLKRMIKFQCYLSIYLLLSSSAASEKGAIERLLPVSLYELTDLSVILTETAAAKAS